MDDAKCTVDDAHGFHCSNMQLEQCQMVVYKFIAAVQCMHVLRQLRRGFCTIVLHYYCGGCSFQLLLSQIHLNQQVQLLA